MGRKLKTVGPKASVPKLQGNCFILLFSLLHTLCASIFNCTMDLHVHAHSFIHVHVHSLVSIVKDILWYYSVHSISAVGLDVLPDTCSSNTKQRKCKQDTC